MRLKRQAKSAFEEVETDGNERDMRVGGMVGAS